VVVGEARIVTSPRLALASKVPVLIHGGLAVAVHLNGAEVVIPHSHALQLVHVVRAGLQIDAVTAIVAVLEDRDDAGRLVAAQSASVILRFLIDLSELLLDDGAMSGGVLNKGQNDG